MASKEMCKGIRESIKESMDRVESAKNSIELLNKEKSSNNDELARHEKRLVQLPREIEKKEMDGKDASKLRDELIWYEGKVRGIKERIDKINDRITFEKQTMKMVDDQLPQLVENESFYCKEGGIDISTGSSKKRW